MCPYCAIYVSSCRFICVSSALLLCIPTLLYMCPHAASYAAIYVSSCCDCRSAWRAATPSTRSMLRMSSVPWARTMKNRKGEFCKLSASTWTNYYVAKYENRKCVYVRLYDVCMDIVWYTYIDICIHIYLSIYLSIYIYIYRERERFVQTGQSAKHTPLIESEKKKRDRLTHSHRRQQTRWVV